jgi:hypothetical protein
VVLTGTFSPEITDAATSPTSLGVISAADLYVIETLGLGSACHGKKVPQYFNVTIYYTGADGKPAEIVRRVTLNDCNTVQTDQVNLVAGSTVYVSIAPVNVPVDNTPGSGGAQITVNVRQYVSTDILLPTDEYCSEIEYRQTEPAYVQKYWSQARRDRHCPSIPFFFGLSSRLTGMNHYPPVPTDADVPAGLAILPLGFHYPQTDTDKKHRSLVGLWAIERQKIYIAPWINSSETVIVKWDGIKRSWADTDPIDDDPLLAEAVLAFVRQNHFTYWDRDYEAAAAAQAAYNEARAKLIHECREETRVRGDEPSLARATSINSGTGSLFYNTAQSATANCASGQTGNPVTVTIPAGTVASSTSQADANATALAQAQQQAQAKLDCQQPTVTYLNAAQSYTASCVGETGAPTPTGGTPVTVTIPAGQFTSTISQEDADDQAKAAAQSQAESQLTGCIWQNSAQTYTAICPVNSSVTASSTTPAGTYSSTVSQADADAQALTAAKNAANAAIAAGGLCVSGGGGGAAVVYYNVAYTATYSATVQTESTFQNPPR